MACGHVLGDAFGESEGDGFYNPIADVGPTDDWSRLGIPTTDNNINFEDLMVFAMNFGVVSAAKADVTIGTSVELVWVSYDDGTMGLRLEDGHGLKGVRVVADAAVRDVRITGRGVATAREPDPGGPPLAPPTAPRAGTGRGSDRGSDWPCRRWRALSC